MSKKVNKTKRSTLTENEIKAISTVIDQDFDGDIKTKKKEPPRYGYLLGKPIKIKRSKNKIYKSSADVPAPVDDIDAASMDSYINVLKRLYVPSMQTAFCREYRSRKLVSNALIANLEELSDDDRYFVNMMSIIQTLLKNGVHAFSYDYLSKTMDDKTTIEIEEYPGKAGYFRLAKGSEPIPKLSRQMTNYIIDNAAAICRMQISPSVYPSWKIGVQDVSSMYRAVCEHRIGYSEFHKYPELEKELDIRECMLGDIEYLTYARNTPILAFIDDGLVVMKLYRKCGEPMTISPRFGVKCNVITNPGALLKYGYEI